MEQKKQLPDPTRKGDRRRAEGGKDGNRRGNRAEHPSNLMGVRPGQVHRASTWWEANSTEHAGPKYPTSAPTREAEREGRARDGEGRSRDGEEQGRGEGHQPIKSQLDKKAPRGSPGKSVSLLHFLLQPELYTRNFSVTLL